MGLLLRALPLVLAVHLSCANSNFLEFGARRPGDVLLFEYSLARRFMPLQVVTESVIYPMTPEQKAGLITQIEIKGSSGNPDDIRIKNGGVGQRFVQIIFQSARSRGLDYEIRIFGLPANHLSTKLPQHQPSKSKANQRPQRMGGEQYEEGSEEGPRQEGAGRGEPEYDERREEGLAKGEAGGKGEGGVDGKRGGSGKGEGGGKGEGSGKGGGVGKGRAEGPGKGHEGRQKEAPGKGVKGVKVMDGSGLELNVT